MSEFTAEPGWLQRQIKNVERDVAQWPDSMKIAAGIDLNTSPHPLQVELDRTKAELGDWRETAQELRALLGISSEERGPRLLDEIYERSAELATNHAAAELDRTKNLLAKTEEERDRLRDLMASINALASRTLAEPKHEDTSVLMAICDTSAPCKPAKPEAPKVCGMCDGIGTVWQGFGLGKTPKEVDCPRCGTGRAQ